MNQHILTGQVDVTSNLLVGSSHLFVDTTNNRVGLVTTDPHAGLHVNSNAYVNTDLRVGSQVEINATPGRVKAASFEGDGSLLVNAPVGSLAVHSTDTGLPGTNAIVTNEGTPTAAEFKFVIPRGDVGATGAAATVATGTTTTGAAGSSASVTNTGTSTAANLEFTVPKGDQGIQGVQGVQGVQGDIGPAGTVAIGTTTTGAAGSSASVTNTGTSTAANLEFTIPRGAQGVQGPAATVAVGTTTTGAAGTNGSVTNSGSSSAAVFDFTVPRGADGADGTNYFTLSGSDIYRSTGNVGIGTTSPSQKFVVMGDSAIIHSNSADTHNTNDRTLYIGGREVNGSLNQSKCAIVSTPSTSHGGAGQYGRNALHFCVGPDAQNNTNASKTDSRMCIDYTGNVGIGTTGPGRPLDVHFTGDTGIRAKNTGSTHASVYIDSASGNSYLRFQSSGAEKFWLQSTPTGDLAFRPSGSGHVMDIKNNGNVGIGTSGPSGKLHIYEPTGTSHGVGVGTLILDHGNSGGSSSIVFPSRVNITSDYGYITYNENYGEAGVSSSENGVLLLGAENDGTGSSDHVRVKTRLVVEADMTSSDPTYAFQVKSSNTTSDLFAVHRGGSIGINGNTLTVPFTIQTNKTIAVNGTSYNSYCRWYRGSGGWYIGSDNSTDWNQNLYWFSYINATGNPLRKVIMFENDQSKGTNLNANTFTGQHRNRVKGVNPTNIGTRVGLIVSADNNENIKVNGGVERGLDAITINETIPYVSVTTKAYDKQVFGVISGSEDPESREDKFGRVTSTFTKEEGDDRIFINSLGEGAMWISNQNGTLESGDYVTSSNIPGYGMKQDSEFLANYTVAKITMNCDFQATPRVKYRIKTERKTVNYYRHGESFLKESDYNKLESDTQSDYTLEQYEENVNILDEHGQLQWEDSGESEAPYQVRYLLPDGTQISEEEYTTRALADEKVYIAAFVGCTYHCG